MSVRAQLASHHSYARRTLDGPPSARCVSYPSLLTARMKIQVRRPTVATGRQWRRARAVRCPPRRPPQQQRQRQRQRQRHRRTRGFQSKPASPAASHGTKKTACGSMMTSEASSQVLTKGGIVRRGQTMSTTGASFPASTVPARPPLMMPGAPLQARRMCLAGLTPEGMGLR